MSLPLDILEGIAARSDPAAVVRCAATCKDLRRRIADDANFHPQLRLRRSDCFVTSLLRGNLFGNLNPKRETFLVDAAAAASTPASSPDDAGKPLGLQGDLVASRDGLILTRRRILDPYVEELRVYSCTTGRCHALPTGPTWHGLYALLVGDDGEVAGGGGRRFQVIKACLLKSMSDHRHIFILKIKSFSSEHDTWSPIREIPLHGIDGVELGREIGKPLVTADGAVHWLCMTNSASYVLTLDDAGAEFVSSTKLPKRFHRAVPDPAVLATATAGGSPVVLFADRDKILMWGRRGHSASAMWAERPQVVMDTQAMLQFTQQSRSRWWQQTPQLEWFSERSGIALVRIPDCGSFWLDLRSKKVVRWFSCSGNTSYSTLNCPYEIDLSSWVPTFDKSFS